MWLIKLYVELQCCCCYHCCCCCCYCYWLSNVLATFVGFAFILAWVQFCFLRRIFLFLLKFPVSCCVCVCVVCMCVCDMIWNVKGMSATFAFIYVCRQLLGLAAKSLAQGMKGRDGVSPFYELLLACWIYGHKKLVKAYYWVCNNCVCMCLGMCVCCVFVFCDVAGELLSKKRSRRREREEEKELP